MAKKHDKRSDDGKFTNADSKPGEHSTSACLDARDQDRIKRMGPPAGPYNRGSAGAAERP